MSGYLAGVLKYGTTEIAYSVQFSDRKTLEIKVNPAGEVELSAPCGTSLALLEEKIRKRAVWILRQQAYFKTFGARIPVRQYVSGESHFYLGRQYLLRVVEGRPDTVKYKGRYFEIVCAPKSKAGELMKAWYREHAQLKFTELAAPIIERFQRYGVKPVALDIRGMDNRWGSCTNRGRIILNTELIKAPFPCIEYVITHEMCHLLHREHTRAFFELLAFEMPDWEKWKNRLETFMQ